jgi:hypothetical protein
MKTIYLVYNGVLKPRTKMLKKTLWCMEATKKNAIQKQERRPIRTEYNSKFHYRQCGRARVKKRVYDQIYDLKT